MNTLHFCRDGILRRTITTRVPEAMDDRRFETRLIPVQAWEASADPDIFLKSLHDVIIFEKGLTVADLFENLAPWAETLRGVACMDFPAFLTEMRSIPENPDVEIEKISLYYHAEITAVPLFERDTAKGETGLLDFGNPAYTGRLKVEEGWHMTAYLKEESRDEYDGSDSVSMSFTPLSEWKHLEIVIDPKACLRDSTAGDHSSVYLGTKESITDQGHPNVAIVNASNGDVYGHDIAIDPPAPTFFDALVRGFLWDVGFHYSPVQRDDSRDKVMEAMDEVISSNDADTDIDAEDEIDAEALAEMQMMRTLQAKSAEMGLSVTEREIEDEND
ncbi:MAG TPA: hypothetical protein ENH63_14860 [Sulfitobacter litoralis]|uniref:Uncharacterized protein n=1 Tax=Sulfitobacter litoralis TaxID=335975 RepID=A0A7V1BGW6_9RHOB|nr:hypothetical protein [Sulfitobacter litoralis]HDZ53016.1 hypothetical protein [Sulfitobacter litoralis]